jgi:hypothetical protein
MKFKPFDKTPSMETWFLFWLTELKQAGYIEEFKVGKEVPYFSITLPAISSIKTSKVLYKGTKRERVQESVKTKTILNGSTYKPDAFIVWSDKSLGLFHTPFKIDDISVHNNPTPFFSHAAKDKSGSLKYFSYTDVKSPYSGKNCSDSTFPINRKIVFEKYNIFINKTVLMPNKKKFVPSKYLFSATFTPERYFYTDKGLKPRKISNFKAIKLAIYLNKR